MNRSMVVVLVALLAVAAVVLTVDPLGFLGPSSAPAAGDGSEEGGGLLGTEGPRPVGLVTKGSAEALLGHGGEPVGEIDLGLGTAAVRGRVEKAAGGPLAGARITVALEAEGAGERGVRTGPDGAFLVRGLPEGVHMVWATHPGYRTHSGPTPQLAADAEMTLEPFVLEPRVDLRTTIQVLVTDYAGAAIPGAKVLATTMPWDMHIASGPEGVGMPGVRSRAGVTDGEGRAVLPDLEPDEYNVVVSAPGHATESRDRVQVSQGTTRRLTFRLDAAVAIEGRLVDHEGQGLKGFVMGFRQPTWQSSMPAMSAADGQFVLDGLRAGDHMVVAYAEEHGQTMAPGKAPGRGLELRLGGAGRVVGRVVGEDGEPVGGGHVRPFQSTFFSYYYSQVHPVGPDGTFALALPRGDWELRVESEGGAVSEDTKVAVEIGETSEVEIRLPAVNVVQGVVVDAAGHHVEGAEVFVMQGGFPPTPSREHWARSDDEGRFEVIGLTAGAIGLHVQHPGYAKEVIEATAAPRKGVTPVRVVLQQGATLEGRVLDAAGEPVPGQQVTAMPEGSYMEALTTWSAADGRYRLTPLDGGSWSVGAGPLGAPLARETVKLGNGTTTTLDLRLPPTGGSLTGLVRVGGTAVAGAEVVVSDGRGIGSGRAVTNEEGRFTVEGLAIGRVSVTATSGSTARGTASVVIPDEPPTADVTIDIGTATFRARIVGADGTPLSGVFSNLESPDAVGGGNTRWSPLPQTGADGQIVASGVTPGRWRLRATEAAHAHFLSDPFDLVEGGTVDLGTVTMRRAAEIRGRVTNDAGAVVENATASVKRPNGEPVFFFSIATTGSDGRFVLRGIEAGSYRLRVEALGHAPYEAPLDVPAEGVETTAVLPRGGGLVFDVRTTDDEPLGSARIILYDAAMQPVLRTLSIVNFTDSGVRWTGADGSAVIDDLAAGTYRVAAQRDGYEMDGPAVAVGVRPGERSTVRVLLRPTPE